MKIVIWQNDLDDALWQGLKSRNIEIALILNASHPQIPSVTAYDLFFATGDAQKFESQHHAPNALSDDFLDEYSRCVARTAFNPLTSENNFRSGGLVHQDSVMDWAQFHIGVAKNALIAAQPDQLWMCNRPHMGFDNALVEAARDLNIKTLQFTPTPFPAKFGYSILHDDRKSSPGRIGPFQRHNLDGFSPDLFYMAAIRRDQAVGSIGRLRRNTAVAIKLKSPAKVLAAWYDSAIRRRKIVVPSLLELLDRNQRRAVPVRYQRRREQRRLVGAQRHINPDDVSEPFVYFPLHLEPEASISGVKNGFYNQVNAIQHLAARLPQSWKILVKENPKQDYLHRDLMFYRRLQAMGRVHFVSEGALSQSLIKRSKFVATINGTAGFEALRTGKPVVYFGDPWYAELPGAVRFEEELNFVEVSNAVIHQHTINEALGSLSENLADGVVNSWMAAILPEETSWAQLMETTAESLVKISNA